MKSTVPGASPLSRAVRMKSLPLPADTSQFDLSLALAEDERGFAGRWVYRTDLFDAATVGRLAGYFETLLAGALARPELALSDLPLLPRPSATSWWAATTIDSTARSISRQPSASGSEAVATASRAACSSTT